MTSRAPRSLRRELLDTLRAASPNVLLGPPGVLIAYGVAFWLTPSRATSDFFAAASEIIPVLLLVLAVEVRVFQLRSSPELQSDHLPLRRLASGRASVDEAVTDVVREARRWADYLLRRLTSLVLLAGLLVGEVLSLVPLLGGGASHALARPVMAAIVAGLTGVAYVALTGAPFTGGPQRDEDATDGGGEMAGTRGA